MKSVLGMKEQIASIVCIAIVAQIFLQGVYANHCIQYDPSTRTITVVCGSASLSDIDEQLVDSIHFKTRISRNLDVKC